MKEDIVKRDKLNNISFIKTIMMLIVVLYHSILFFSNNWFKYCTPIYSATYFNYISKWLNTFHVQAFTMSSGYLFFYLVYEKHKYNELFESIRKRFFRLIIPYFSTCCFWVIPITLIFYNYGYKEIFYKYILMTSPSQLWYLIMLFLVFIFFIAFHNKIKYNVFWLIGIYIITTMCSCFLNLLSIDYFQIATSIQFIFYFYIGGYLFFNYDKILKGHKIIILLIMIILLFVLFYVEKSNLSILSSLFRIISPILSFAEVFLIYDLSNLFLKLFGKITESKIYKCLERNSFGIFLFHQQIIYFFIVFLNGKVHPMIQVIVSFIFSVVISSIICLILRRNKILKFLFGL